MVGHERSSAGSYLADPTSPIPSHCASIVVTSTLRVNLYHYLSCLVLAGYLFWVCPALSVSWSRPRWCRCWGAPPAAGNWVGLNIIGIEGGGGCSWNINTTVKISEVLLDHTNGWVLSQIGAVTQCKFRKLLYLLLFTELFHEDVSSLIRKKSVIHTTVL